MKPSPKNALRALAIGGSLIGLLVLLLPDRLQVREERATASRGSGILASFDAEAPTAWAGDRSPLGDSIALDGFADPDERSGLDPTDDASGDPARGTAPLDCLIEPWEVVEIGSPVRAVIEEILVERADTIEAGQELVRLDREVERASVVVAAKRASMKGELRTREADLAFGNSKRKRAQELHERDVVSLDFREEFETEAKVKEEQLRLAKENLQLASLELEHAKAVLARRSIRSPISGAVVSRMMAPGERVDEEPILRIAQLDPLRVEVILPAALYGSIRPGARATLMLEHREHEVHLAEVTLVDPVIDAASGTFGVRLRLPNPDHAIPGGLHCEIDFVGDEDTEAP
ncbi:MAG: efflux RND transporter periplasmic adaptor subunit [Myxococcales bacterium]|nr:efflux RND transporter periplasmic adaptor subunit [Myxococcales bacterium]